MASIARVIVDIALDREFDYLVPDEFGDAVCVGTRVNVPFGKRRVSGYVAGLSGGSSRRSLKAILSVADEKPYISDKLLELARWMADYYCTSVEASIRSILPGAVRKPGKRFKKRRFVALTEETAGQGRDHAKEESPDRVNRIAEESLSGKQRIVLETLSAHGGMFLKDLLVETGTTEAPVKSLEKKGLVEIRRQVEERNPLANRTILPTEPHVLTGFQAQALEKIEKSIDDAGRTGTGADPVPANIVLLYGVTGSGKTEVYMQAIEHALKAGKGAIVLVPEISLTPQTVERFVARFGSRIAVLHSHLSEGERHDEWHRIREGKADIVIGARSAVFAPVKNLGLIVVDEEHETSYKQEDVPRYNARDVATMRARLENCAVALGSATPAMESWYNALRGKYILAKLPERVDNRQMPVIRVVDMRMEGRSGGKSGIFSSTLIEAVRNRLDRGEQVILFLNRRGFATSLVCPRCGYVANCENCSVSCTYHRKDDLLKCHICGATRKVPGKCPGCGDPAFKYAGVGTQRVEAIVKKCFPKANVERMDTDMTRRKGSYERLLGDFRTGKTNILIGTQMIAKGLHFPNVTLVGVVYADMSLHMPDFRAGERTFQLLAQVAGRAGRGEIPGEVIVQTYTPFHGAVQAARRVDFEGFCDAEIEFRKELQYPPCSRLICMNFSGVSEEKVSFSAVTVARNLKKLLPDNTIVSDAAAAPLARANGRYRYQVMLRGKSVTPMTRCIRKALKEITFPEGVKCAVDVDAISLL